VQPTSTHDLSGEGTCLPSEYSIDDENEPASPKIQLAMWDLGNMMQKGALARNSLDLNLLTELHVSAGFGGIVLSPVATHGVSIYEYPLIKQRGLAVVDCSWA